jgi:hypothetical protein
MSIREDTHARYGRGSRFWRRQLLAQPRIAVAQHGKQLGRALLLTTLIASARHMAVSIGSRSLHRDDADLRVGGVDGTGGGIGIGQDDAHDGWSLRPKAQMPRAATLTAPAALVTSDVTCSPTVPRTGEWRRAPPLPVQSC